MDKDRSRPPTDASAQCFVPTPVAFHTPAALALHPFMTTPETTSTTASEWRAVSDTTRAPSHLLADGQAIVLPAPPAALRRRWVERAIVQHGLLQSWISSSQAGEGGEDGDSGMNDGESPPAPAQTQPPPEEAAEKKEKLQIHPLALASTKLQTEGIDEINRTINLTGLVTTREYFKLINIIADKNLEITAAASTQSSNETSEPVSAGAAATTNTNTATTAPSSTAIPTVNDSPTTDDLQNSQKLASTYVLKRKHQQFAQAATVLRRHRRRLQLGLPHDAKVLQRWAQLRHRWRLVAPDHAKRAIAHPVLPTEVLAADVDTAGAASLGRLARRMPRYATLALRAEALTLTNGGNGNDNGNNVCNSDNKSSSSSSNNNNNNNKAITQSSACWTYAEPFALADPTLGKMDAEWDPSQIEMLTLQFTLEHVSAAGDCSSQSSQNSGSISSTITSASACLEPTQTQDLTLPDEQVLFELQHSLLCSKLFESMRRELADDTDEVGQVRTTSQQLFRNVAWMAPTSGLAAQTFHAAGRPDRPTLQVVQVHEGQVSVQLSAEYTLRVQLVPASSSSSSSDMTTNNGGSTGHHHDHLVSTEHAQLLLWCRTLLWHAHSLYHQHFTPAEVSSPSPSSSAENNMAPTSTASSKDISHKPPPHILQSCVHLGSKLLMERNLRRCFHHLQTQQKEKGGLPLQITCLSTSALSAASHWTLTCGHDWQADVALEGGPRLTVTWWQSSSYHRKVDFVSLGPFRLFLERQLRGLS